MVTQSPEEFKRYLKNLTVDVSLARKLSSVSIPCFSYVYKYWKQLSTLQYLDHA